MIGGDLPAWLLDLLGRGRITRLADRRGECIYSACEHYRKCFVERTIRRARQADIVIANHALVMIQAAMGGLDDGTRPLRYVFDEGHHLFDAADSAFGAHLSGVEASDLRRWLLGAEGRRGSRARGLERRLGDLLGEDPEAQQALRRLLSWRSNCPRPTGRRGLPTAPCWGRPRNSSPWCASRCARAASGEDQGFGQECDVRPAQSRRARGGRPAGRGAGADARPGAQAARRRCAPSSKARPTSSSRASARASRAWRARSPTAASSPWRRGAPCCAACTTMPDPGLRRLVRHREEPEPRDRCRHVPPLSRSHRAFREFGDPKPRTARSSPRPPCAIRWACRPPPTTRTPDALADWMVAEARTGTRHLAAPAMRAAMASPFDYADATRVLIVRDVKRDDADQVAAAYRELFLAAAAARSACSPPSAACAPCTSASPRRWRRPACRSTPSMSAAWMPPPWSTSSVPRSIPACSAPMRCATASTCPAARCG